MCQFAVNCGSTVYARVIGPYDGANPSSLVAAIAPWSDVRAARASPHMSLLFDEPEGDGGVFFALLAWMLATDQR